AGSFVYQIFLIAEQQLGNLVGVVQLTLANKVRCADNRRASLPHVLRTRKFVKNLARLVEQVAADDMNGTDVNQIPVVDAVVSLEIKVVEFFSSLRRSLFTARLLVHDAAPACAHFMNFAFE